MATIPTSLKLVTSSLRRAEELEKDSNYECQVVSYYCRFYVVSKGSSLCSNPPTSEESNFLVTQMDALEKMKPNLDLNQEKGKELCASYADKIFNKADEVDRLGLADKATAKMFYSAGTFYDIMEQFGDIDPEIGEKKKYAKWKATEILNALREGRVPTPGGYGDQSASDGAGDNASQHSGSIATTGTGNGSAVPYDIPTPPADAPSAAFTTNIPAAPNTSQSPPPDYSASYAHIPAQPTSIAPPTGQQQNATAPYFPPRAANTVTTPAQTYQMYQQNPPPSFTHPPLSQTDPRVRDSVELCQFAIAAMNKNNLAVARERLAEALRRLE